MPGRDAPSVTDLADALQRRRHSIVGLVDRAEAADLVRSAATTTTDAGASSNSPGRERGARTAVRAAHRHELRTFRDEMTDLLRELD